MGNSLSCKCPECGFSFSALIGIGYMYPLVYNDTLQKIREGEYGKDAASFISEHPDAIVDASDAVYLCSSCHNLQAEQVLGLYLPKEETAENENDRRLVLPCDFRGNYKLVKPYAHRCERCQSKTKKLTETSFRKLIAQHQLLCPGCNAPLDIVDNGILWD